MSACPSQGQVWPLDQLFGNLLVGSCKEPDETDQAGKTALHYACGLGALDMVTKLVEAGADVNLKSKSGRTPLARAITQNRLKVVKYLLQNRADANEQTRDERPPLLLAIGMQSEAIAKQLLDHGADPHWRSSWGVTALHAACYDGSAPITRLLLEYEAAVDARDDDGWSPLHYAAQANSKECAELLLAAGGSPLSESSFGSTPFAIAVRRRATSVVEILNSHENSSASSAASLPARLAVALESGYVDLVESLLKGLTRSAISVGVVRDVLALALRTEKQDLEQNLFQQLVENVLKPEGTDERSSEMPEGAVWSDTEEQVLRKSSWGTDVQKAMVLDPVWGHFRGARDLVPDAMLPVAVANRSHDVVKLLLARGADMYRRIGGDDGGFSSSSFSSSSSASSSALQLAINQNSRELVTLMLAEGGRHSTADSSMALLAALEEAGSRGGMTRTDLTKMLIVYGALDADAKTDVAVAAAGADGGDADVVNKNDTGDDDNDSGVGGEPPTDASDGNDIADDPDSGGDDGHRDDRDLGWWTDALVGKWAGDYSYSYGRPDEPTGFEIRAVSRESLSALKKDLILFSGGGEDIVAEFTIHGQIMSGKTVRFVKLYPSFGWMYEGDVDETESGERRLKGRWGRRFGGEPGGQFLVTKERAS